MEDKIRIFGEDGVKPNKYNHTYSPAHATNSTVIEIRNGFMHIANIPATVIKLKMPPYLKESL